MTRIVKYRKIFVIDRSKNPKNEEMTEENEVVDEIVIDETKMIANPAVMELFKSIKKLFEEKGYVVEV